MNNQRMDELVRMAAEVDAIEREAEGIAPISFSLGRDPRENTGRRSAAWMGVGAAACLAVVGVGGWSLWNEVSGARRSIAVISQTPPIEPERAVVVAPEPVEPPEVEPDPEPVRPPVVTLATHAPTPQDEHLCGVVMVIEHDLRGFARCVHVKPENWRGRCAADVPAWEIALARRSVATACAPHASRQVLVLALSGPPEALPTTQRRADEVASCILGLPRSCDVEGACFKSAAENCLPPDVEFKVEAVALR